MISDRPNATALLVYLAAIFAISYIKERQRLNALVSSIERDFLARSEQIAERMERARREEFADA